MKKLLGVLLIFIALVIGVILVFNTITVSSKQNQATLVEPMPLNTKAVGRLAQSIKLPTISTPVIDTAVFTKFKELIGQKFSSVFKHTGVEYQYINEFSLILKWNGRNPSKKPVLLLANQDVLDPDLKTIPEWSYNPFLGKLKDNKVWGRGTLDGKVSVLAILEALRLVTSEDWVPERTLYCVFTHDSYNLETASAKAIAWMFQQAGIEFEFGLATGNGLWAEGVLSVEQPMALVGVAAKNKVKIELKDNKNNMGELKSASQTLQTNVLYNDLRKGLSNSFLTFLTPEMPFMQRMVGANLWLLKWFAHQSIANDKVAQASLWSTIELEQLKKKAGDSTEAVLHTLLSKDWDMSDFEQELNDWIANRNIKVELSSEGAYAQNIASAEGYSFDLLQTTIKEVFAETLVIPTTRFKYTDANYFAALTEQLYYFSPVEQSTRTLLETNPIDDVISFENYQQLIHFYYQLIRNTTR
ncbi:MAG: M20/M25/M40 family metallo-hydrolase [Aureispira sp.]|nr:M20/M25/M40 family metallo-hydrolase [Aureispira sp.]